MSDRRVVITGVGAVSPFGTGFDAFCDATFAGTSGVTAHDFGPFRMPVAAVPLAEEALGELGAASTYGAPRAVRFAVLAAREAAAQAWGGLPEAARRETGVFVGTGSPATGVICAAQPHFERAGEVPPYALLAGLPGGPATYVALDGGYGGACRGIASACASASIAIAQAYAEIAVGRLPRAIAGGAESPLTGIEVASWRALRALAPVDPDDPARSCRPFDTHRRGLVLGEGAALFALEELSAAQARGAPILAEILGVGESCDATHMTRPDADGQARCMRRALGATGTDAVDLVVAHGTGTPVSDLCETGAIGAVFGPRADEITVVSNKALIGHTLGAAGGFNLATALMALHQRRWAGSYNIDRFDERVGLECLVNRSVERDCRAALVNAFAFGGTNCSILLGRMEER